MNETRTEIVPVQLANGTTMKVQATALGGDEDVLDLQKVFPFKEVTDTIEGIADAMIASLRKIKPSKASVEFGIELGLESGALTTLLVKGTGSSNIKIVLEWSNSTP